MWGTVSLHKKLESARDVWVMVMVIVAMVAMVMVVMVMVGGRW